MSFEQGRETLDTTPARNSPASPNEPELPLPPKPPAAEPVTSSVAPETRERLDHVLQSDIGISTLLSRLKQSVSSARDFAIFLKERSALEEKHAQGLKRLSRGTYEIIRRPESKGGSFAHSYEELTSIHDRMSDNGLQFAGSLHQMHDELQDLASNCERGRKQWKQTGLASEKRVQDAELAMDKAKGKYNALAEQYDRARTGERQSGKFGLKGPKSAAQQEEDLHRKVEAADGDYELKVKAAQSQRQELLSMHRPQAVRALEELIKECDAGLSMQLQKFASLNEKLLLGNGLCVSPLKNQTNGAAQGRSLRDVAQSIDNERDFHEYVLGFTNKAGMRPTDIKYEKHPALSPKQQQHTQQPSQSFDAAQPQFGTPERTNTGHDPYSQGHRPNQSGQISGVLPYQASGGDRMNMSSPQGPYPPAQHPQGQHPPGPHSPSQGPYPPGVHPPGQHLPGPHPSSQGPGQNNAQLPQLPQIESLSMGGGLGPDHRPNMTPPTGPGPQHNPAYQNQNRPSQDINFGSPSSPVTSHNQQVTMPTVGSMNNYGSGPRSDAMGGRPPQGQGYPYDNRGPPNQGSFGPGSRGPSMGQPNDFRPDQPGNRGPSLGQSSDFRPDQPGARGPSLGQSNDFRPDQQGNRGPSLGQSSDFRPDGRSGPAYGQQGYQPDPLGRPPQNGGGYRPQGAHPGPSNSLGSAAAATAAGVGAGAGLAAGAGAMAATNAQRPANPQARNLPPTKPVFGVPLDELFRRDGTAVPLIVSQCVSAVDLFGLETEGIYRTSGSAPHIMEMKALFDHDSSLVDFRNPAAFHHDIASVTTLLKHFLRDLPDSLLTAAQYNAFIQAAKIDDDISRRDTLHAIINSLPDPNYATLRLLTLHLDRVSRHAEKNRMTKSNLAICFGPTVMGSSPPGASNGGAAAQGPGGLGGDIKDAGWQARVVETILNNTYQIFDDDE